ncbi:Uncharacterized protein Fot_37487 [Forsythia ovata]|uniref:Glabrous enhancer-binding protein-like DBD domain-containing protein n=1 Tax=Forsythia ovata TaxID=205694 RepID=A0ABD1RZ51_9LAMI
MCDMQNQTLEEETLIEKIQTTELEATAEKEVGSNSDSVSNFEGSVAAALEEETQIPKAAEQQKKGSNSDLDSKTLQENNDIIMPIQSNELIQKKPPVFISHIFTDNDVIALLQSFIDFKSHHRDKNMTFFHSYVKDKLQTEYTKNQLTEKLRRLKEKYFGNSQKAKKKGARLDFANPHDSTIFDLSHKLWGNDGFSASSEMLKKNWTLMGSCDAQYFEEEWRKIRIEEAELHHKKLSLMTKMAGVVLESLKD